MTILQGSPLLFQQTSMSAFPSLNKCSTTSSSPCSLWVTGIPLIIIKLLTPGRSYLLPHWPRQPHRVGLKPLVVHHQGCGAELEHDILSQVLSWCAYEKWFKHTGCPKKSGISVLGAFQEVKWPQIKKWKKINPS